MSMDVALSQMFTHNLAVRKGPPQDHRLTFAAEGNDAADVIYDGSLCSLNSSGKLVKGVPNGNGTNLPMPLWAKTNSYDAGVRRLGHQAFGGMYMTLVATGGYELETTEYVAGGQTYAPNDALVAATGEDAGKVTKAATAAYGANAIVGIVSSGTKTMQADVAVSRLAFWTVFLPATVNSSSSSSSSSSEESSSSSAE